MYDFEKYESIIKERLSEHRFIHSMNVAKRARELAKIYGLDEDKAYLTGILHDITKETDYAEQEKYMDNSGTAIRYHTTGRADMTDFEMMIYLADLTSEERCYPDVEKVRGIADNSLEDAMLYATRFTITDLANKNRVIHPDTLYCYNWVLGKATVENTEQ